MDWSPSRLVLVASGTLVAVGESYAGALCLQPASEAVQATRITRNLPTASALAPPHLPPGVDPLVTVTALPAALPAASAARPTPTPAAARPTAATRAAYQPQPLPQPGSTAIPVVPADPLQN